MMVLVVLLVRVSWWEYAVAMSNVLSCVLGRVAPMW